MVWVPMDMILSPSYRFWACHPAWGYMAEEHGLVQVAIEEHGKEPDAAELAALIKRARAARPPPRF